MNDNILQLFEISKKENRNIIGLMSGTSLDGLDIALVNISGSGLSTLVVLKEFETIPYSENTKEKIRAVFAKQQVDFQHLTLLNEWIGSFHATLINKFLTDRKIGKAEIDLIASHGQTVFHAPKSLHQQAEYANATLQIGDGDHIAVETGIITLSDFRQKHIAAGGEGAPLAIYGDYFLFAKKGENRIMLNMGGIANFTFLPASNDPSTVFVTDTGPGNTLIDSYTRHYYPEKAFDLNAELASKGKINSDLLSALKAHNFFDQPFPKTTGPELFGRKYVEHAKEISATTQINCFDLLATLTRFSAETIAEAILKVANNKEKFTIYMSGGGMHNPLIVRYLSDLLPNFILSKSDELGIAGDAKEAILFAVLANEAVAGGKTNFGNRAGIPSTSFGKISFPK